MTGDTATIASPDFVGFVNVDAVYDSGTYCFSYKGLPFSFAWKISPGNSTSGTGLIFQSEGTGQDLSLIHVNWGGYYYDCWNASSFRNTVALPRSPDDWHQVTIHDTGQTISIEVDGVALDFFGQGSTPVSAFEADVVPGFVGIGQGAGQQVSYAGIRFASDSNHPPVVFAVEDSMVFPLVPCVIAPVGVDADGDTLAWSGFDLPLGATVDAATGIFSWTPSLNQAGTHPGITLTANDGKGGVASTSFAITVLQLPPPFQLAWGTPGTQRWNVEAPSAVAIAPDGTLYVADTGHHRVQQTTAYGSYLFGWGMLGSAQGQFNAPKGLAVDSNGNVYVADTFNNRVQEFTSTGQFLTAWGSFGSGAGQFKSPTSIAVDMNSNVFVVDQQNARVQKFTSTGTPLASWGEFGSQSGEFNSPSGVAVAPDGSVFVGDTGNNRVQRFTNTGAYLGSWGDYGAMLGRLDAPSGVAVDASGDVYVVDTNNQRVQEFTATGTVVTAWGEYGTANGTFAFPAGVATDLAGNVYVADTQNNRVQKFGPIPSAIAPPTAGPFDNATDDALTIAIRPIPLRSSRGEAVVTLKRAASVSWSVWDVRGRRQIGGALGVRPAGGITIPLATRLAAGVYVLSVQAGEQMRRSVFVVGQ